jgi:hypothetical protein
MESNGKTEKDINTRATLLQGICANGETTKFLASVRLPVQMENEVIDSVQFFVNPKPLNCIILGTNCLSKFNIKLFSPRVKTYSSSYNETNVAGFVGCYKLQIMEGTKDCDNRKIQEFPSQEVKQKTSKIVSNPQKDSATDKTELTRANVTKQPTDTRKPNPIKRTFYSSRPAYKDLIKEMIESEKQRNGFLRSTGNWNQNHHSNRRMAQLHRQPQQLPHHHRRYYTNSNNSNHQSRQSNHLKSINLNIRPKTQADHGMHQ